MDKEKLREEILAQIELPRIPERSFYAPDLGVMPSSGKNERERLQAAIDRVHSQGGGRLLLPAGDYLTGSLQLKSGVELCLAEADTRLLFVFENLGENYPLALSHWEASPCMNHRALLYALSESDIAVTGKGCLDGGGSPETWWSYHHQVEEAWSANRRDLQQEDRLALRRMNQEGVPVSERIFGEGHYLRPNFVQFLSCERVLLQGITLKNSPMWQLNPVKCSSVTVDGVTLSSHGSNNDGCDPESCRGVWIKNCTFDTGDDCISLKSGRDRDGREAKLPCEDVLIEHNTFADGHGGIALGSEMSGGIRRVLALSNAFSSPHLTYALRLKTNAKRGGFVSQVMLCDSVIDEIHGAAIHGTMLYEDGRNGDDLPVFEDIAMENVKARGGDYGIFLEAFPEVPLRGLSLRNIEITGARKPLRSLNWEKPQLTNVRINGKEYPRPGYVRILGIPHPGETVTASAEHCGGEDPLTFRWEVIGKDEETRAPQKSEKNVRETKDQTRVAEKEGTGETFRIPEDAAFLRVWARDRAGREEPSRLYRVLPSRETGIRGRLSCRGMDSSRIRDEEPVTRLALAVLLAPLADPSWPPLLPTDTKEEAAALAAANGFFALDEQGRFRPCETLTRQEMATVAMQACGVSYRNASSTRPVCADAAEVDNHFATNVARSLYFRFMELEDGPGDQPGFFYPRRLVTGRKALEIIGRVADFAGI